MKFQDFYQRQDKFTSAFSISAVTPSAPGVLPLFIALIAVVTSCRLGGSAV
jgi:hypothetical protein